MAAFDKASFPIGKAQVTKNSRPYFVFELANNHGGDVERAKRIISNLAAISNKLGIRAAVKFQFRHLPTLLHPSLSRSNRGGKAERHADRFLETELSREEFRELVFYANEFDLTPIATPFDEESVEWCEEFDLSVIKVASCSNDDWPLLERIARSGRPVILSTGGTDVSNLDRIYLFFRSAQIPLALLHCVGLYPTPPHVLNLRAINALSHRYPDVVVGYSGHESPDMLIEASLAEAAGARILERHVGEPSDTSPLNDYSLDIGKVEEWVSGVLRSSETGGSGIIGNGIKSEQESLRSLKRGIYTTRAIAPGEVIRRFHVALQMPCGEDQYGAADLDLVVGAKVSEPGLHPHAPLLKNRSMTGSPAVRIERYRAMFRAILIEAHVVLPPNAKVDLSHPYGMEQFDTCGSFVVEVVNREYCKKFIALAPGQRHPRHRHRIKEESFHVLSGDLWINLNDTKRYLQTGEVIVINRGDWHEFGSETGVVIEEISTTHVHGDSEYADATIPHEPLRRKTQIDL